MKRILITGKHSYVGTSFQKWMEQFGNEYQIETISLRNPTWKNYDFSVYDSIFHVTGIAHADVAKVSEETKKQYYQVNCDLAFETAQKYKNDLNGKKGQFIYMSSIIVYGIESNINKKRIITSETIPKPSNFYGDSKLKAEKELTSLISVSFKIVILRPPMIYGKNSKGNFPQLVRIANKTPVFPKIKNIRSMLYIDNLCSYLKNVIDDGKVGIYFPQNKEYVVTSELVQEVAKVNGKRIIFTSFFNGLVKLLSFFPGRIGNMVNKAFGSLVYEKNEDNFNFIEFKETIEHSVGNVKNGK